MEKEPAIKKSTILNEKAKTERFFCIKSQTKMAIVGCIKKSYHLTKGQNKKLGLYQELRVVIVSHIKKTYHPTKGQNKELVLY